MAISTKHSVPGNPYTDYYTQLSQSNDNTVVPPQDLERPFTFQQWYQRNTQAGDNADIQYNQYLTSWYHHQSQIVPQSNNIRQDYLNLISQLQAIFGNDDRQFNNIATLDATDPYEVEVLIPLVVQKLQQIANYYLAQRKAVQSAKAKYNLTGSAQAIDKVFRQQLLSKFTKREMMEPIDDQRVWTSIPELSSITSNFNIEIVELIDDTNYFDRDPDNSIGYQNDNSWELFASLSPTTTTNPLVFSLAQFVAQYNDTSSIPLSAISSLQQSDAADLNVYVQNELTNKYISSAQYGITGGYWHYPTKQFPLDIQQGVNTIEWPGGEYYYDRDTTQYRDVKLNQTQFATYGTGGATIDTSDVIWITTNGTISGAWLRSVSHTSSDDIMVAQLYQNSTLKFKWPYPGFGVIDHRGQWSNKQLTNFANGDDYSSNHDPAEAERLYWTGYSTHPCLSTAHSVSLHDTTLIDLGAKSSPVSFIESDIIRIRDIGHPDNIHDATPNNVFNNAIEMIWLFQPITTELVFVGGNTNVYWPYFAGELASSPPFQIRNDAASPTILSQLESNKVCVGAVAGQSPDDADMIIRTFCGEQTEAAWLSGCPAKALNTSTTTYVSGTVQPGLSFVAQGGEYTRFIFDDIAGDTSLNDIANFVGFNHEPDCPYNRVNHKSLSNSNRNVAGYDDECQQYQQCSCRAIWHSPLGHPGDNRTDYNGVTDIIFEDTQWPSTPDFSTWVGPDGGSNTSSSHFAWFQLNPGGPDIDVGWGSGTWKNANGHVSSLKLESGKRYVYYRRPVCCGNVETPPLFVSHGYCGCKVTVDQQTQTCKQCITPWDTTNLTPCDCTSVGVTSTQCCIPVWAKAVKDLSGNWVATQQVSDMVLAPGDTLTYVHRNSKPYTWHTTGESLTGSLNISAPSYLFLAPLSGWDPSESQVDPTHKGARPYWATVGDGYKSIAINCAMPTSPAVVEQYLVTNHPAPTVAMLQDDTYIEYRRKGSPFTWVQPIRLDVESPSQQWCHIAIDPRHVDQIITALHHNNCDDCEQQIQSTIFAAKCKCDDYTTINDLLIEGGCVSTRVLVSATTSPSQALISTGDGCSQYSVIAYCANNAFSVNHTLCATEQHRVHVAPSAVEINTPKAPWANLGNRMFPTIAIAPNTRDLTQQQYKGIFTPNRLGITRFEGDGYVLGIDGLVNNTATEQITITTDSMLYANPIGHTKIDQPSASVIVATDARAFKYGATNGVYGGTIKTDGRQTFSPYQATYEDTHQATGLAPFDKYLSDPWTGPYDQTWENPDKYPASFIRYYSHCCAPSSWTAQQNRLTGVTVNWTSDIYGNQYGLLKSPTDCNSTLSHKASAVGELWVRTVGGTLADAPNALIGVYDTYAALTPPVFAHLQQNNAIQSVNVFYDTIMVTLSSTVIFEKLQFDYDRDQIYSIADYAFFVDVSADTSANNYSMGHWFDELGAQVIFGVTSSYTPTSFIPKLWVYKLSDNSPSILFPATDQHSNDWHDVVNTTYMPTLLSAPKLTYNSTTRQIIMTALVALSGDMLNKAILTSLFDFSLQGGAIGNTYVTITT